MRTKMHDLLGGFQDTTMFMTLMVWICIVPFVVLFTLPFFGWQGGLTAAVITFIIALIVCWGICAFPQIPVEENSNARRPSVRQTH